MAPLSSRFSLPENSHTTGIALVAGSAVLWSTAGLFVRMAGVDAWSVLGWRSLFSASFLGLYYVAGRGWRGRSMRAVLGGSEWFMIVTSIIATIAYVFALKLTTVANVMTVYATLPFIAAGIAFVCLRERAGRRTLIASAIALVGIAIMAGSLTAQRDILGTLAALVMTAGFAGQLVFARRHPDVDLTLAVALSGALCAVLSWPFMAPGLPSPQQLVVLATFGILTTGIAYLMALGGGKRISSGEAGFISLLDVVLGPLWVWLFFAEAPGRPVLVGGAIVLAAVLWYLAVGLRESARPACA